MATTADRIEPVVIEEEIQSSFIDYAMSVIVSRALPDVRDGLKPVVLPGRFPNLLANGSQGIAVGMATNIPPHNLGEVIDGVVAMIEDPDITVRELMKKIKGPDFPTAGLIIGREGIKDAYETG